MRRLAGIVRGAFRAGGRWLYSRAVTGWLRMQGVRVGPNCTFYGVPQIRRASRSTIQIGDRCAIRSGARSNLFSRGLPTVLSTVKPDATLTIADECRISDCVIVCATRVEIGRATHIGGEVLITDTDAHPTCPACREAHAPAGTAPVLVGEGCFVGTRSILLKGVRLADECCVAAGSVVSRTAEPASGIIGGNPARQLRPATLCTDHAAARLTSEPTGRE